MQLNNLIIETRVRSGWSSIDLGFVLGRLFWLRGFCLYLVMATPVFLVTRLISDSQTVLPYIILWWFKPLFERPILFFLSRELFSQKMNFWNTLRNYRQWLWPSIGWVLTLRRLNVGRAMYAPISLLEQPPGKQYSQRVSTLGSKYSSESAWLTIVLYHVESFLSLALLVLLALFFPEKVEVSLALFNDLDANNIYIDAATVLIMALIAPFYTAAGFMLYISRRVELEGWDIEICFRDWMLGFKEPVRTISEVNREQT